MASKNMFHQSLLGKHLKENPKLAAYNDRVTFKYYGLEGDTVEIVGAWVSGDIVSVLVKDTAGHTKELFITHYLLVD